MGTGGAGGGATVGVGEGAGVAVAGGAELLMEPEPLPENWLDRGVATRDDDAARDAGGPAATATRTAVPVAGCGLAGSFKAGTAVTVGTMVDCRLAAGATRLGLDAWLRVATPAANATPNAIATAKLRSMATGAPRRTPTLAAACFACKRDPARASPSRFTEFASTPTS